MPNAESLEKMQVVVDSLRSNPDVVVAGGFERNNLQTGQWPDANGYWARTLDIYTHPTEPIYDADELNDFMFGLVPELEPTASDRFRDWDREIELGKLYYDESIGQAALSATVQLKDNISLVRSGIVLPEWQTSRTVDLRQRTWVRIFPDRGHLTDAAQGINEYRIPRRELGKWAGEQVLDSLLETPLLSQIVDVNSVES